MAQEIVIGMPTVIGLGLASLTGVLLPAVLWMIWRKKSRAAWTPLLAGVVGYLFIGTARGLARALLLTPMQDTPWAFYLWQAVFAGVFEEGGRYLIYRFVMPNRDRYPDAASYGLGHGGLEHIIVNWNNALFFGFVVGFIYHVQGMDGLLAAGMDADGLPELLQDNADHSLFSSVLLMLDNIGSLLFQCSMSVLVFTAVHFDQSPRWFIAAILLHVFADIPTALHFAGDLTEMEMHILALLYMPGAVYLTYRVRTHFHQDRNFT
jgi:uncharacterized membrane protein YhfC